MSRRPWRWGQPPPRTPPSWAGSPTKTQAQVQQIDYTKLAPADYGKLTTEQRWNLFHQIVDASPASAGMTAAEKTSVENHLLALGDQLQKAAEARAIASGPRRMPGATSQWYVNVGWGGIYLKEMSPSDQRWFLGTSAAAAGAAICATPGVGQAVCAVAGAVAASASIAISEHLSNLRCWADLEFDWAGNFQKYRILHC